MAYIKTDWKNRLVERPRTFRMQQNADGTVTLNAEEGQIIDPGTPLNAENLNKIENQLEANASELAQMATKQGDLITLKTNAKTNLVGAVNELFQSVSDGKAIVATAITDKGVPTVATDTFQTMANNVQSIKVGDFSIGDTIKDFNLRIDFEKGEGRTIWANPLKNAVWVDIDKESNIYIIHKNTGIVKRDLFGNELWRKTDLIDSGNSNACVKVDHEGNIIYSIINGNSPFSTRLRKIDKLGNEIWLKTISTTGIAGQGIDVDEDNNIYVTFSTEKMIVKYDKNGNEIFRLTNLNNMTGILYKNDYLYGISSMTTGKRIYKWDKFGTLIWEDAYTIASQGIQDIAVTNDGVIYVTHNDTSYGLSKFDSSGTRLWRITPICAGICIDPAENIYVGAGSQSSGRSILKYDRNGKRKRDSQDNQWGVTLGGNVGGSVCRLLWTGDGAIYACYDVNDSRYNPLTKLDCATYYTIV